MSLSGEALRAVARRIHRAFWDARREAEREADRRRGVRRADPVFIPFEVEGENWEGAVRTVLTAGPDPGGPAHLGRRLFRSFRDPGKIGKTTDSDGWWNLYPPVRAGYEAAGSALFELKEGETP